jgi:hypothetical protein
MPVPVGASAASAADPRYVQPIAYPASAGVVPAQMSNGLAAPMPVAVPAAVKLSVANVKKEEALLFFVTPDCKLTFARKVAPGEAVDVQATPGQRWIAVFADRPAGDSFAVPGADAVWLLR